MNFLYNLDALLQMNKMTRSELARQIGIAPSTINAWYTKGCDGVGLKTIIKISHLFDVTIDGTTLTIDSSSNDVEYGSPISFTHEITPATATGTIQFYYASNNTNLGN